MNNTKSVTAKWQTDGDLAVIYQVENILLFYSKSKDPYFKKDQVLAEEETKATGFYKAISFSMDNVPNDAYVDLSFAWSK